MLREPGVMFTVDPVTSDVGEIIAFGLYGWALSRFSGNWVGLTALSEIVESGATDDLDRIGEHVRAWVDGDAVRAATGWQPPPGGLHYRWPDLPSLAIEERLHAKLDAVRAFARQNRIDRDIGIDLSLGLQWRPLLTDNIIITASGAVLLPGQGFRQIYTDDELYSTFVALTLTY